MGTQDKPIKVGGQALADGVLMRTSRAWAIARADGSVEVGALAPTRFAKIPVLRVVGALGGALKLAVSRGMLGRGAATDAETKAPTSREASRLNRRLLVILAVLEALALAYTLTIERDLPAHGLAGAVALLAPWIVTLAVVRVATPQSLWRYHGAEHKAVAAHEQGIDLDDTAAVLRADRVHDRCGTNLIVLLLIATFFTRNVADGLLQIPAFLVLLGAAAEIVSLAAKRPTSLPSRLILAPGKALQRWVTTAEPTAAEQAVGAAALLACLEEHARVVALDEQPVPAVALAAA